jgi:hypothetical protein
MNKELQQATSDPALRRVLPFEYVHQRLLPHLERPEVLVVRYERWFDDREALLRDLSQFLGHCITAKHIEIRRLESGGLSRRDRDLIGRHCTTAAHFGYAIN